MMLQLLLRHKNNVIPKEDWDSFLKLQHHMDDLEKGARDGIEYARDTLGDVRLIVRISAKYSDLPADAGNAELIAGRVRHLIK